MALAVGQQAAWPGWGEALEVEASLVTVRVDCLVTLEVVLEGAELEGVSLDKALKLRLVVDSSIQGALAAAQGGCFKHPHHKVSADCSVVYHSDDCDIMPPLNWHFCSLILQLDLDNKRRE